MYKRIIFSLIVIFEVSFIFFLLYHNNYNFNKKDSAPIKETEYADYPLLCQEHSNNSKLILENIPNFEQYFDGVIEKIRTTHIKINSDGFRDDRNYTIDRSNNTFRIIVLGDSITFGMGIENNETYPKVLERKLNSLNNGIYYEVLNFGVVGYATIQEVELLKVKGLKYEADLVIVCFVGNDAIDPYKSEELEEKLRKKYNMTHDSFEEDKIAWWKRFQEYDEEILKVYLKFNNWEKIVQGPLDDLKNISIKNNFSVLILSWTSLNDQVTHLLKIANKNKWFFVNAYDFLSKYKEEETGIPTLNYHPNAFGNRVMGEGLFEYLLTNI